MLTVPLAFDRDWLATLAFLGGFSSATSMVIVASIAVSTMVSNHIVMPIWLRSRPSGATVSGDLRQVVLVSRRVTIAAVLFLGYLYYRVSGGGTALAAIGLISFAGVAQILPALLGGIFWRGATRFGSGRGCHRGVRDLGVGRCFFRVSAKAACSAPIVLATGPWGIAALRPQALFGLEGLDPLVHSVVWSMSFNTLAFLVGSFLTFPTPLERLQGASFVNALSPVGGARSWAVSGAGAEELLVMAQRIVGGRDAQALFEAGGGGPGQGRLPARGHAGLSRTSRADAGGLGGRRHGPRDGRADHRKEPAFRSMT